jgi:hypothetical protein
VAGRVVAPSAEVDAPGSWAGSDRSSSPVRCHTPVGHSLRTGGVISDVHTGDDVLEWLDTTDAAQQARRIAIRRGLSGFDALSANVVQDAKVAVWMRMQSSAPLDVDSPAAYGTTVIRSVVRKLAQGRDRLVPDHLADGGGAGGAHFDVGADPGEMHLLDDLRVVVERLTDRQPWVTSAMLSFVTLTAYPEVELDGVPRPAAGATPDQARGWPALWFAGKRDHFPQEEDSQRDRARKNQARSRMIRTVLERLERARALFLIELAVDDG